MLKLALLGLLAALQLSAADPRIGSWTLVSAQSALNPPNKLSVTALQDGVHVVISGDTHVDRRSRGVACSEVSPACELA